MRARAPVLTVLALLGGAGCEATTEPLELRGRDASRPAPDAEPGPRDATPGAPDAEPFVECRVAEDCPGTLRPCNGPLSSCRCDCFRTCDQGRCVPFCDQGPSCFPTDAGVRPECIFPTECPPQVGARACGDRSEAACAFDRCVGACTPGIRCVDSGNGCVECGIPNQPVPVSCPSCISIGLERGRVEASSCPMTIGPGEVFLSFRPDDCGFDVRLPPGASGRLQPYDNGILIGELDVFDGRCIVEAAPTGAFRTVWGCPGCTFTILHF